MNLLKLPLSSYKNLLLLNLLLTILIFSIAIEWSYAWILIKEDYSDPVLLWIIRFIIETPLYIFFNLIPSIYLIIIQLIQLSKIVKFKR